MANVQGKKRPAGKSTVADRRHEAQAATISNAAAEERAACIAICRSAMSKHWTPADYDGLDGLDRVDYHDAACDRIASAIGARGQK